MRGKQEKADQEHKEARQGRDAADGDDLKAASDEAVRFMEEGDEPGHAGRGDGG